MKILKEKIKMVETIKTKNDDGTEGVETTISFAEVREAKDYYKDNPLSNYHNIWKERLEMLLNFAKGEGICVEETCLVMFYVKLESGGATESIIVPSRK